jgi:hypothetical protein
LSGFKVAIDADLLLSKVTSYSVHKSIRESNASIDKFLEANLIEILTRFKSEFNIELVIVLPGLKPPTLQSNVASLENSYAVWS